MIEPCAEAVAVRPLSSDGREAGYDRVAMLLSSLCLVHCLALPVVLAFLPSLTVFVPEGEFFHALLLAIALPFSGVALYRGWSRHRRIIPALICTAGFLVMTLALSMHPASTMEVTLTVGGGLIVALGHFLNLRAASPSGV